jgi:putative SOS response-associated peptidase YedK
MRWGLIPSWATDPRIANQCINARAETIDTKPAFREPYLRGQRGLIVVDGWYEWMTLPSRRRQPFAIRLPDASPFAFAGLWDTWRSPESGEAVTTCTIVTTVTGVATAHLHHRMPVVLGRGDYRKWLEPGTAPADLRAMLVPYAGALDIFPVSTALNAGTTDEPGCLERVTDEAEPSLWQ